MGNLFGKNSKPVTHGTQKAHSKGQRLGWAHKSEYKPIALCHVSANAEKLRTYTSGPFSSNKLVP